MKDCMNMSPDRQNIQTETPQNLLEVRKEELERLVTLDSALFLRFLITNWIVLFANFGLDTEISNYISLTFLLYAAYLIPAISENQRKAKQITTEIQQIKNALD